MSLRTSRNWCMIFAITNLGLGIYNGSQFNLGVGIAMCVWVMLLNFLEEKNEK